MFDKHTFWSNQWTAPHKPYCEDLIHKANIALRRHNCVPIDLHNKFAALESEKQGTFPGKIPCSAATSSLDSQESKSINRSVHFLCEVLEAFRPAAVASAQENLLEPSCVDIRRAILSSHPDRALVLNHWAPPELLALPDAVLEDFAALIFKSELLMAPPLQSLAVLVALLLKPAGGDRPIGLTSMWYCVWSALRTPSCDM